MPQDTTLDTLFSGALKLHQPARGHRAGTDAVLLAAACPPGGVIADVGSGVGTVGLRAAQMHAQARVFLVEREALAVALARQNILENQLIGRVEVTEGDVFAKSFALPHLADVVLTNPPFDEPGTVRVSPDARRAGAHVLAGPFEHWLKASLRLLRPNGAIVLIHRADALSRILAAAEGRLGDLRLRFIHPTQGQAATRVLLYGRRASKAPLRVLPPLVLHGPDGAFTPEADAIHRGMASLSW